MKKKIISILITLTLLLTMAVPMSTMPSFATSDQVVVNIRPDCLDYKEKRNRYAFDVVASHDGKIAVFTATAGSKITAENVRKSFAKSDFTQVKKGQEVTVFTRYSNVYDGKTYDFYLLFIDDSGKEHGLFSFKNVEARYLPIGDGSVRNPYQIWTPRQLFNMASLGYKKENANVKLMQNLDLTGHTYQGDVMGYASPYYGTFDGNKKVIKGMTGRIVHKLQPSGMIHELHIGSSKADDSTFFVLDNYGTIKNCSVANVQLQGGSINNIGIFAGYNRVGGIVKNCAANATTQISGDTIMGTIVGRNYGTIDTCAARSDVIGSMVGGIAGRNDDTGIIKNCGYNGTVLSGYYRGGIVGQNAGGAMINNVSAWGPVDPYEDNSGSVAGRYKTMASAANFGAVKLLPTFQTDENGNENSPQEQQRLINDWMCRHGVYKGASDWISPIWYAVTWNFSAQIWQPYNLGSLLFHMHTAETIEYNQIRPFTQFIRSGSGTEINPDDPKPPEDPEAPEDPGESDEPIDTIKAVSENSSYKPALYQSQTGGGEADLVKIDMPKTGTLLINAASKGNESSIDMELLAVDQQKIDTTTVSKGEVKTWMVSLKEGANYSLKIRGNGSDCRLHFSVTYVPAGGTLTRGITYYGASPDGTYSYYKVTAPKNGYFTVKLSDVEKDSKTYVKLLSSTEKTISSSVGLTGNTRYGVNKGTYYIGVKSTSKVYGIKARLTTVTESKAGTTRAKATRIYKGATKKGVITASQSSKTADWYKFTISKSQRVYLDVETRIGSGQLRIAVYKSGKTANCGASLYDKDYSKGTIMPYTSKYTKKLSKGTYYIKIEKKNSGNGFYNIHW